MVSILVRENPFVQSSASSNRLLSLLEGLTLLGVEIKLIIYGGYKSIEEKNRFQAKGVYKDIKYEYILNVLVLGYWRVRFFNYVGYGILSKFLKKRVIISFQHETAIVWTDLSEFSFNIVAEIKARDHGIKLFIEMSEFLDIHNLNRGNFIQRWKGNFTQKLFEENAFFSYDGMALMTKTLINHYQIFPKPQPKFLHLPMTVDLARFDAPKKKCDEFKGPYVAFVGVMNDAKDGVSILIRAFDSIKNKFPNYKLYLVGPWNYDTPIHLKLIKKLGLEDRVFWMKEYKRDLIPGIICNAELLVLPRPDSKQAQGGFPTKLGEYLATGNPVCATRVGEIPYYLTDNESVFFADPGSFESFADAMNRALSDPKNAKRVGANGRKVAEKEFNKEIQAKKLYEFFQQLISS